MNPQVYWGWGFVVLGAALILWDVWESLISKTVTQKVQEARAAVDGAINANQASVNALAGAPGLLSAEQQSTVTAAAVQLDVAKLKLDEVLNEALSALAKAHPKLVVGIAILVLAASAFGVPLVYIGTAP